MPHSDPHTSDRPAEWAPPPTPALLDAFRSVPANRFMNFELLGHSPQRVEARMHLLREYTQEHGVVHGALVTALADTAAVWTFHPDLREGQSMASIEFKINFVGPAFLDGGPLTARSSLVRRGSRVGVCDVEVFQADREDAAPRLVAKGLFTYLFFHRGGAGGPDRA